MLLFTREPGFAKLVIPYLRSRILRIEEDLVDQIFHPSEKRLARILLLLAPFGRKCESKSEVLKVSQQTLAEIGRYHPLANQLLHEPVQTNGIHPLQGWLTGAPGAIRLRPPGVIVM